MKVTKSCRYLDSERGNAALHIFGFLVHQKKIFLIASLKEGMLQVLFCSIYYCFQFFKILVTILTVCFPSSLAYQSYCKPLLLSWKREFILNMRFCGWFCGWVFFFNSLLLSIWEGSRDV